MTATEVPDIVHLVFNMELLAISSMAEVRSEHKVCFGASLRHTKGFWAAKKSHKFTFLATLLSKDQVKFLKLNSDFSNWIFVYCHKLSKTHSPSVLFKASALWADAFYKSICPSVCPCVCLSVCLFTFEVPFKRLFVPTPQSRMSNIFRDSESLGKSNGKRWSQIWKFLFEDCLKSPRKKVFSFTFFGLLRFSVFFYGLFAPTSRSQMSNIFRDSESLGKSNGKKWSQIWTFLFENCLKSPR